jgi:ubiquinone/menaquinone biosynthesis C-methylase UbiE|tara:strand:- start:294 stop:956 length:663 start_codon:yes stop_codon:yes gene_type:complete
MKKRNFITSLHQSTNRNYLARMVNDKVLAMKVAKKYDKNYWDGPRKFGYGGFKYIPGRLTSLAKKIVKTYNLTNSSKVLDVGCGKGYLLYEIKKILPDIQLVGFDISSYAIKNSKAEVKKYIYKYNAIKKFKYKKDYFDLVMSFGTLHNLKLDKLFSCIKEIERVGKKNFIMVESYRNDQELFNLQCWALTCETFLSVDQWIWLYKHASYRGDYEFIYFR